MELKEMRTPAVAESDLVTGGASGAPALVSGSSGLEDEQIAEERIARTTSSKDKEIFTNRHVWFTAAFLFLYVGAEVSM